MTDEIVELVLYVTGDSGRARRAIDSLQSLCDRQLPAGSHFRVVDVVAEPELARKARILATPTLQKLSPGPPRRIVGDIASMDGVLSALDLEPK
ncbi:MAG: circadian clock KaiB family protein [Oleiphilaceae bacterium]|nr:circadian clock KaiB family protein [Oleiphilaceae bacterium]